MVRLSKIYTKFGDAGSTMLGDGSTVLKSCPRVDAYGEVDEANAAELSSGASGELQEAYRTTTATGFIERRG